MQADIQVATFCFNKRGIPELGASGIMGHTVKMFHSKCMDLGPFYYITNLFRTYRSYIFNIFRESRINAQSEDKEQAEIIY